MNDMDHSPSELGFFLPDLETASPEKREDHWNAGLMGAAKAAFKKSSPFNKLLTKAGIGRGDINSRQALTRVQILRFDPGSDLAVALEETSAVSATVVANWQQTLYAAGLRACHSVQIPIGRNRVYPAMIIDKAAQALGCASIHTGAAGLDFQIQLLRQLEPTAVVTTPGWLTLAIDRVGHLRLDIKRDLNVSVWMTMGEIMSPKRRNRLEQLLGQDVWQVYHVPGIGCLGYECSARSGFHVPDGILPEIIDGKSQESLSPDNFGEFTATLLDLKHPILRLATGDTGLLTHRPCECGRTSPRFITRTEDEFLFSGFDR